MAKKRTWPPWNAAWPMADWIKCFPGILSGGDRPPPRNVIDRFEENIISVCMKLMHRIIQNEGKKINAHHRSSRHMKDSLRWLSDCQAVDLEATQLPINEFFKVWSPLSSRQSSSIIKWQYFLDDVGAKDLIYSQEQFADPSYAGE